jgi:hypothetical protein
MGLPENIRRIMEKVKIIGTKKIISETLPTISTILLPIR